MKLKWFKKKKLSDDEKIKRAKIELVIFLVFIAFVFAYSKIILVRNNNSSINREQFMYKVDLGSINTYDFEIKINIDGTKYDYNGNIDNNNGSMGEYKIVNNVYYDSNLKKVDDVFHGIDSRYFSLNTINGYLKESNYKNGRYESYISDIINNNLVNLLVFANVNYSKDKAIINIDYSTLGHEINNSINSYKVEYIVSNYK